MAVFKFVHAEMGNRHANVLFLAARVGEAEIDKTNFLFFNQLEYFLGGHGALLRVNGEYKMIKNEEGA